MAFAVFDRVRETSTVAGTGSATLAGAVTGYQSFGSVLSTGDTTYYCIASQGGSEWEVGIGTFTAPSTLARTTIISSSNAGSVVSFSAGNKDVFITQPASKTFFNTGGTITGAITVGGLVQSTSGGFKFPDNTIQTTAATSGASYTVGELYFGNTAPATGTWLETGKYYSKATYSSLATAVGNFPDFGQPLLSGNATIRAPIVTTFNTTAGTFNQSCVATDGSVWVAAGFGGAIRYSTDGTNWRAVAANVTTNFWGITYVNSMFIAYGASVLVTSPDGLSWTVRVAPSQTITCIAYNAGTYVVGTGNATNGIYYSTDLLTWTQTAATTTGGVNALIYANSLFVAAIGNLSTLATSSDGITWTTRASGLTAGFRMVRYVNSVFYAMGQGVSTSSDGITWTARLDLAATSGTIYDIAYSGSLYAVAGWNGANSSPTVWTSAAGTSWTSAFVGNTGGGGFRVLYGIVWTGTVFAGGGRDGYYVYSNGAGTSWTENVTPSLGGIVGTNVVNGRAVGFAINAGATSYIDTGTPTEVFFSGTGGQVIATVNVANPKPVAYGASQGKYVCANNRGAVYYSTDGESWLSALTPDFNNENWDKAFYLNGNYFITGPSAGTGRNLITSSDGITWSYAASGATYAITGAAYALSTYVFVGTGGNITTASSPTGALTSRTSGTAQQLNDLVYANLLFVAVGNAGAITTSADGVTWTAQTVGASNFNRVIYANSIFMAVGASGVIYTSTTGLTWTAQTSGTAQALYDISWNGTAWNVVGAGNIILRSTNATTWTSQTAGTSETFNTIADNGTALVVGSTTTSVIMRSTDNGVTWLRTANTLSSGTNIAIQYLNGKFIQASTAGTQSSTDGYTWATSANVQIVPTSVSKLYKFGSKYFSIGSSGGLLTSSDGVTWTASSRVMRGTFVGMAVLGSTILSVSANSGQPYAVYKSTDTGGTWTKVYEFGTVFSAAISALAIGDIVATSTKFVVSSSIANVQSVYYAIYTSTDGVSWSGSSLAGIFNNQAGNLATDGSSTLLTSVSSLVFKSTDNGATWSIINGASSSGTVLYANGWWASLSNFFYITRDFQNWFQVKQSTLINAVEFTNGAAFISNGTNPYTTIATTQSITPGAPVLFPGGSITGSGKTLPLRGNYSLAPIGTLSNGIGCLYPIIEIPLYTYDTSTTFFVPPANADSGLKSYIYAGP